MKRNDLILMAAVLTIAIAGFLLYASFGKDSAGMITVTVDGEVFGTYSLKKDQEIQINDTNFLIVQDGKADMIEADCPDQICVEQKAVSKNKESIICLPNKVIVEVIGGEETELDEVTN